MSELTKLRGKAACVGAATAGCGEAPGRNATELMAEAVYRADLGLDGALSRACQHPDNVWSLHGLHECLVRRGETALAAIIKQRLDLAAARADVPIKASCYCRMQHAA